MDAVLVTLSGTRKQSTTQDFKSRSISSESEHCIALQKYDTKTQTLEAWVPSWGWEDPLEEGMAIHSSILARRIPWTEEPGRLESTGPQRVRHNCSD